MWDRLSLVAFRWNDGQRPFVGNLLPDLAAAVGFVGDDGERRSVPIQKGVHHLAVMQLAAGYSQSQRSAFGVYSRVNLTCAAAS